jgi:hypothetical protein
MMRWMRGSRFQPAIEDERVLFSNSPMALQFETSAPPDAFGRWRIKRGYNAGDI